MLIQTAQLDRFKMSFVHAFDDLQKYGPQSVADCLFKTCEVCPYHGHIMVIPCCTTYTDPRSIHYHNQMSTVYYQPASVRTCKINQLH